jgi:hypothetical protein
MDVHCSSCGRPWDVHHLRYRAIFDTKLDPLEAEQWCSLSYSERLTGYYREQFKAAGYAFGRSVLNVLHCPHCPIGTVPDPKQVALKHNLELLFGENEEGLAVIFADCEL